MKAATNRKPSPLRVVPTKESEPASAAVIEAGIDVLTEMANSVCKENAAAKAAGETRAAWSSLKTSDGILAAVELLRGEAVTPSALEVAGALEAISWELAGLEDAAGDCDTTAENWGVTIRQAGLEEAKRRLTEYASGAKRAS